MRRQRGMKFSVRLDLCGIGGLRTARVLVRCAPQPMGCRDHLALPFDIALPERVGKAELVDRDLRFGEALDLMRGNRRRRESAVDLR
jgi:hypothetical protein